MCFFSNLFTPGESFSMLPDDNMCGTTRDSLPLKCPYKHISLPSCCRGLLKGVYIHYFCSQSHHCHLTPCAVQATKGQGSHHHSAGLVCKEEVHVKGLCNEPDGSEAEHVL